MIKCPRDEMKWGEWLRHCDSVLGYCWPFDDTSEEGSSALGNPGSLTHDDVCGWMSGEDSVNSWGSQAGRSRMVQDFITLSKMAQNLKHELLISGIFHLIFSDQGWRQVTKTVERKKNTDWRDYCKSIFEFSARIRCMWCCQSIWKGELT